MTEIKKISWMSNRFIIKTSEVVVKLKGGYSPSINVVRNGKGTEINLPEKDIKFKNINQLLGKLEDKDLVNKLSNLNPDWRDDHKRRKKNEIYRVLKGKKDMGEVKKNLEKLVEREEKEKEMRKFLKKEFKKFGSDWEYISEDVDEKKVVILKKSGWRKKDIEHYVFLLGEDKVEGKWTKTGYKTIYDVIKNRDFNKLNRLTNLKPKDVRKLKGDVIPLLKGLASEKSHKTYQKLIGYLTSIQI